MGGRDRHAIKEAPPSVVPAQRDADERAVVDRDRRESGIS